jgi:Zn-dependent oligopeptidase
MNAPFDGKLRQHDITYYTTMREEKEFKIDHAKLQQYFPLDVVLNGIFDIYQVRFIFSYVLEDISTVSNITSRNFRLAITWT